MINSFVDWGRTSPEWPERREKRSITKMKNNNLLNYDKSHENSFGINECNSAHLCVLLDVTLQLLTRSNVS